MAAVAGCAPAELAPDVTSIPVSQAKFVTGNEKLGVGRERGACLPRPVGFQKST